MWNKAKSTLIKEKQHHLSVRFEPFPLLEFSPPLESCADIYVGPTSFLIITLLCNVLFLIFSFFLSAISSILVDLLISVLCTQIERSLLSISTRTPPYSDWLTSVFATRSDTAVKAFVLSACLRSGGWAGPPLLRLMYIAETLINPLFTNVAFRRDSVGDG